MLEFTKKGLPDTDFFGQRAPLDLPLGHFNTPMPVRRSDVDLGEYSRYDYENSMTTKRLVEESVTSR
eukprot:105122-Prorocentrum_minimum.AAC.1